MVSRSAFVAGSTTLMALLFWTGSALPAPQQIGFDRDASARDYVQFLVTEISQWSRDFPRQFYLAVARPPLDSSKLSESVKASPDDFGNSIKQLVSLSNANDILTNADFRQQLDKTIAVAKLVNEAMGGQRFPEPLQRDWTQIRTNLNSLAQIYKLEPLAYLNPAPPGGRGGAARAASAPPPPGAVVGYIVDQSCSLKGKGMWTNAECVARCIRDGDKVVLVTEEGKVFQIANPDKVVSESYGQKVTITGKTEGETITVASLQM
jgi:hypothetical protein